MSDMPVSLTSSPDGYAEWLTDLKNRIHKAQQRATLAVNQELIVLYWQIGRDILTRQAEQGWGAKVIERLSHDLRSAFPEMKGFSRSNLKYMRVFAEAWPEFEIGQQPVGQMGTGGIAQEVLGQSGGGAIVQQALHKWGEGEIVHHLVDKLPWGHHCVLLDKLKTREEREWYLRKAIEHNYLTAVDSQVKHPQDGPTIGLLLCKSKNKVVAEYALYGKTQPLGVAEYQLVESLPPELQTSLPSIEQIERELAGDELPEKEENL